MISYPESIERLFLFSACRFAWSWKLAFRVACVCRSLLNPCWLCVHLHY